MSKKVMRVLILFLAISSSAMAQGLVSRPLVYPGSAFAGQQGLPQRRASQYPPNYSYPRRKAWANWDRQLDIESFDAVTRRHDSLMRNSPFRLEPIIIKELIPRPLRYTRGGER